MKDKRTPAKTETSIDKAIDQQRNTDIDKTAREAERETKTRQPGAANGNQSNQHNNGRGGGK